MLSSLLLDKEKQILRTLETDDYTHLLLNIERWNKPGRKTRKGLCRAYSAEAAAKAGSGFVPRAKAERPKLVLRSAYTLRSATEDGSQSSINMLSPEFLQN